MSLCVITQSTILANENKIVDNDIENAVDIAVWERYLTDKEPIIVEEGENYAMRNLAYNMVAHKDVENGVEYQCDGAYISFKPIKIEYDTGQTYKANIEPVDVLKPSQFIDLGILIEGRPGDEAVGVYYENAFGEGNSIGVLTHRYKFKEVEKINNQPVIPKDAKYLNIYFEIQGDLEIEGWDYSGVFHINNPVKLGKKSWLNPAKAWDSYYERVRVDDEINYLENRIEIDSYFKVDNGKYYYVKSIPVEWLSKAAYPVYTDADVTWGSPYVYNAANVYQPEVCRVDGQTDRFVVIYPDDSTNDPLRIKAATVSGTGVITYGPEATVTASLHSYAMHSVCSINTDKVAVSYIKSFDDDGYTVVATIDWATADGTITIGTEKEFGATDAEYNSSSKLDTDKYIIVYGNEGQSDRLYACVANVSGTTITLGSETELSTTGYRPISISTAQVDTDKVIAGFWAPGVDSNGYITVIEVTGTTPDAGEIKDQGEDKVYHKMFSPFRDFGDANRAIGTWIENEPGTNTGEAMVITISGTTTQTWGPVNENINVGNTGWISGAMTSANNALFVWTDVGDSEKIKSKYSSVDWSTRVISEQLEEEVDSDSFRYLSVDHLGNARVAAVTKNATDVTGEAISGQAPTVTPGTVPSVNTVSVTNVGTVSAYATGEITAINGGTPSERGFCYLLGAGTPTYADTLKNEVWLSGTGTYALTIDSLSCGSFYSLRAYAATTSGTGYGGVITFITLPGSGCYTNEMIKLSFNPSDISWTASGTITDLSPEGNDVVYEFGGTQTGITITLGSLDPTQEIEHLLPELGVPDALGPLDMPDNMWTAEPNPDSWLTEILQPLADIAQIDVIFLLWMIYIGLLGFVILKCMKIVTHMMFALGIAMVITCLFVALGPIPWWMILFHGMGIVAAGTWERKPAF